MNPSPCNQDPLQLHRELDPASESYREFTLHVQTCEECQSTLAELQDLDRLEEDYWESLDPVPLQLPDPQQALVQFHERRAPVAEETGWSAWYQWLPAGGFLSAIAVISLVFWLGPQTPPDRVMKGSAPDTIMLHAYATAPKAPQRTRNGTVLHPGDFVQFVVQAEQPAHVMVLSLNQKGEIFVYAPFKGQASISLSPGKRTFPSSAAFELDNLLGWERFFVVSSQQSFTLEQIEPILRKAVKEGGATAQAQLAYPTPWHVQSTFIQKQSKPAQTP
ncbi:MAG: DUF4384 domain-containing protein [Deltaproteobacteria bacterium]|nr:MAG: DUF4384 domain-containing protein [Deltaproteobacteria bacterium]